MYADFMLSYIIPNVLYRISPDRNGEPASQDTLAFPISVIILQMWARGQD